MNELLNDNHRIHHLETMNVGTEFIPVNSVDDEIFV